VEAVVVVGADDDELEPSAPDLAATTTGQDRAVVSQPLEPARAATARPSAGAAQ